MNIPATPTGVRRASWGATVGTTVALQWMVVLLLAAIAWFWGGQPTAWSLLGGGAAVALPNALFAAWLTLRVRRGGGGAAAMLSGELIKLALTIALLVGLVMSLKPAISWPALIIGVIAALKAQWLAVWVTRDF